ncbi:MAG: alpha/beta hydrolase [Marinobacter sp.]|nr:alpha/beta hydrolase [Marinobacter sp.]
MPSLAPLIAVAILGLQALSGCASHQPRNHHSPLPAPVPVTVEQDILYSPPDWPQDLRADLYLPDGTATRPAVLMVHGGGWERRSREDMDGIASRIASHGFVVMNIDYRFAPQHTFPAQLHDVQVAMQWLRRHSGDYGIDPDRIAAFGFSSGAHLVSLMATVASNGSALNEPFGGPQTRPVAVVAGGLPSDLQAFGDGRLLRQFLGGSQRDRPELYEQASPIAQLTDTAPPFFLFHGGMDLLVPVSQATDFAEELAQQGVEYEFYRMRLRGHVSSFLTARVAVARATAFLLQHAGDGQATTP